MVKVMIEEGALDRSNAAVDDLHQRIADLAEENSRLRTNLTAIDNALRETVKQHRMETESIYSTLRAIDEGAVLPSMAGLLHTSQVLVAKLAAREGLDAAVDRAVENATHNRVWMENVAFETWLVETDVFDAVIREHKALKSPSPPSTPPARSA